MEQEQQTHSHSLPRAFAQEVQYLEQKLKENSNSPLAVRLASHYLKAGRASEAVELCERAVSLYPDYPTAFLILGKCFLALNRYAEAKTAFRRMLSVLPDCLPAQQFLKELASLAPEESHGQKRTDDSVGLAGEEEKHARAAIGGAARDIERPGAETTDLEMLAERLRHLKRTAPDPNAPAHLQPNFDGLSQPVEIVSETMAEIYVSQGAFDDAIRVYRLLIKEKPDSEERYKARIQELQEKK